MTTAFAVETLTATAVRHRGDRSIDQVTYDSLPLAEPGPGEVLVAIKAVSLNYRDLSIIGGPAKAPLVLASDAAGEVIAVGEGVQRVAVGDRVAAIVTSSSDD